MHSFLTMSAVASAMLLGSVADAQSRYENPVDKKTYQTSGQFKKYQPATPRDVRGQRVTTEEVILLTGEPDLESRVKVEDLTAFIKTAEARAYPELAKNKTAMVALVQFNCQPGKCEVKLASQGAAEGGTLQGLYESLSKLAPLRASGEVAFQVKFNVAS